MICEDVKKAINHIETIAEKHEVSLMTYADLHDNYDVFLRNENKDYFISNGFLWSISLAMHISQSACDLLQFHTDRGLLMYFSKHCLGQADLLEIASQKIATYIDSAGYKAIVIPGRASGYQEGAPGIISHRMLAYLSGMGSIGDSGMIITKKYGPRVRLSSIITTMPLPADKNKEPADYCLHCGKCRDICPANAIYGCAFDIKIPDVPLMDNQACSDYRNKRLDELGTKFCNLCQYICPVGKEYKGK